MKKIKLLITAVFLLIVLTIGLTISTSAEDVIQSGTWGDLTWTLNETTGELTISGEGAMNDFSSLSTAAWQVHRKNVKSVTIQSDVTSIGDLAFNGCTNLTSITIPNSVTSIGRAVFMGCNLGSITIPKNVTSIDNWALYTCGADMSSIKVEQGNARYHSEGNCLIETESKLLIAGCKDSVIPADGSVTSLGECAFNSMNLRSITIPSSIISIHERAFSGCASLNSITVDQGNTKYSCVGNCLIETESKTLVRGCANSVIPADGSVKSIGSDAFSYVKLTTFTIPQCVTSIGDGAFSFCRELTTIIIPESITRIGEYAFEGCVNLAGITIPNGVTSIEDYTFSACMRLTTITIPETVTSIGSLAFCNCEGLGSIKLPNGVKSIGDYAFKDCKSLRSITIPNGVTSIGRSMFEGCIELTSIVLPHHVTNIGKNAFSGCSALKSVSLSNLVTSIEDAAFKNCTSLESITYCGTEWQWNALYKGNAWDKNTGSYTVVYHVFDNGAELIAPTETSEGLKIHTCTMCGATKLETIEKLPAHTHSYDDGEILTNPSESNEGVKVYTCACGQVKFETIDKLPAHTHSYDDGEILTNPSESNEGVKVFTCACGQVKFETIDKLPAHTHSYDDGEILTNPSESNEGIKIYTCECGETKLETIEKLPAHVHTYVDENDADCESCGQVRFVASGCGASVSGGIGLVALLLVATVGVGFRRKED